MFGLVQKARLTVRQSNGNPEPLTALDGEFKPQRQHGFFRPTELSAWFVLVLTDERGLAMQNAQNIVTQVVQGCRGGGMKVTLEAPQIIYRTP